MEALRVILLICHFAALAVLLGAVAVRLAARVPAAAVLVGAAGALLGTGVLLVAVRAAGDLPVNGPKTAVKLAVAAAVLGCAVFARRRAALPGVPSPAGGALPSAPPAGDRSAVLFSAVGLLGIVNVAIAVAWT